MRTLMTLAIAALALGMNGGAYVLRVPTEYPTIQAAIDAAGEGDTVLVADGTYAGDGNRDLDFGGVNLVVMSEHGPEVTIIDCDGTAQDPHRGFYFHAGEDSASVVEGFTITDGCVLGGPGSGSGGGVLCTSSPTVAGNIVTGNTAAWGGGGIACYGSSSPLIVGNTITLNSAPSGGGIACVYSSATIANNVISRNTVSSAGGGVICSDCQPIIVGGTITENTTLFSGGGIACNNFAHPMVFNSIVWGDSAVTGSEILLDETAGITVTYSDIEGGWPGEGNIDVDPLFVPGPLGYYYLSQIAAGQSEQSPCVDEGDPSSSISDGTTRTDEVPDSLPVDMGYHYPIGGVGVSKEEKEDSPGLSQRLAQAYPNPFSSTATISYSLPAFGTVHLAVYDVRGALVRTLVSGTAAAGRHQVVWDGRDERGRKVGSGVYFCRLETGEYTETRRMILLR